MARMKEKRPLRAREVAGRNGGLRHRGVHEPSGAGSTQGAAENAGTSVCPPGKPWLHQPHARAPQKNAAALSA